MDDSYLALASLRDFISPLEHARGPLSQAGAAVFARATALKSEFEAARKHRIELRRNGGLETPICKLNLLVRLRSGRPSMEWRRTTHRRNSRVFTRTCALANLGKYTNDLDHELVVSCENRLKLLRQYWSNMVLIRRKIDAYLTSAIKLCETVDDVDERDHLPIARQHAVIPTSNQGARKRASHNTLLAPTEFPAIRTDD